MSKNDLFLRLKLKAKDPRKFYKDNYLLRLCVFIVLGVILSGQPVSAEQEIFKVQKVTRLKLKI